MTQELVLIRGLPGSGKSTRAISEFVPKGYIHCEADVYHMEGGVYVFRIKEAPVAHAFCQYKAFQNMAAGRNVVVSNTFTRISEMLPYIRFAQKFGIVYQVIECTGDFGTTHGVPAETLADMKARWEVITENSFKY